MKRPKLDKSGGVFFKTPPDQFNNDLAFFKPRPVPVAF